MGGLPRRRRRLATVSVIALLLWLAIWFGVAEPPGALPALMAVALLWLPLAPAVPFLHRGRRGAFIWGSMIGVIYAGLALAELIANPQVRLWASGAFGLSCAVTAVLLRGARRWPTGSDRTS